MWLILHSAAVLLLALCVLSLCRWGRLGPAARHALWLLVLLKLLTPPVLSWPWAIPLGRATDSKRESVTADSLVSEGSESVFLDRPFSLPDSKPGDNLLSLVPATQSPSRANASAPAEEAQSSLRDRYFAMAIAVWLCVGIALAFCQLRWLIRRRHWLKNAIPASSWLIGQVEELASILEVKPPRLAVLPGLSSPLIWAGGRACLLWPEGLEKHLAPEGCRAVLVHELAHLSRRDHWVGWLLVVAGCVWWWHPLFYLIRRQLLRHAELACDARVVASLPDTRRSYAEALLDVCQRQSWTAATMPALGVAGSRRDLERRLVMIMRANVPSRLTVRGLVGIALVGVILLPAWTLGRDDRKPANTEHEKQLQSLEHKLREALKDLEAQRKAPATTAPTKDNGARQSVEGVNFLYSFVDSGTVKPLEQDKKLLELEAKVKVLLKEVQTLRNNKAASAQTPSQTWTKLEHTNANEYWTVVQPSHFAAVNSAPTEVALSRTTYKLSADKAKALGEFLQKHVKASVMETKVEGESLVVTTTPEVQRGIGQFINLIEGKTTHSQGKTYLYENRLQPQAK